MTAGRRGPAWARLVAHSHRIGMRWLARGLRGGGWPDARGGLYRLLVPLEPWRYHEVARVAREPITGDCLDVSSPKLLPSLLAHEGAGTWVAIDLLPGEIARWQALDAALDLRVADARALPFDDASFDAVVCVSVIEHVEGDGDGVAMAEMWRVLRPGGVLHLTTNVSARAGEVRTARAVYAPPADDDAPAPPHDHAIGPASSADPGATVTGGAPTAGSAAPAGGGPEGVFFERHYDETTLATRLLRQPWEVQAREYVGERLPVHRWFFGARPLSFVLGNLLPLVCPLNFRRLASAADVPPGRHGVVYMRLRRPS